MAAPCFWDSMPQSNDCNQNMGLIASCRIGGASHAEDMCKAMHLIIIGPAARASQHIQAHLLLHVWDNVKSVRDLWDACTRAACVASRHASCRRQAGHHAVWRQVTCVGTIRASTCDDAFRNDRSMYAIGCGLRPCILSC